jgi:hypothetical protein
MNVIIVVSLSFIGLLGAYSSFASELPVQKSSSSSKQNIKIIEPTSRARGQKSTILSCASVFDNVRKVTSK